MSEYDPCFVSGINGDWNDYGGICPHWGYPECSCDAGVIEVFYELLDDMAVSADEWHAMDDDEKRDAAFVPGH